MSPLDLQSTIDLTAIFARCRATESIGISAMSQQFDFSLDEDWPQNLQRLKAYLEGLDPECAEMLFDSLDTLQSDHANARRDFNQKVFESIMTAARAEINGAAD